MTVRELLAELQHFPRDLEVLAFEAGSEFCRGAWVGESSLSWFLLLKNHSGLLSGVHDMCRARCSLSV
jgi:hypothetical protein